MPGNRKEAEAFIIKYVEQMLPGGGNAEIYRSKFAKMSDQEFEAMIEKIEAKKPVLKIVSPNLQKQKLDVGRNLAIAKELGYNFFQKVFVPARDGIPAHWTVKPHLLMHLPARRQAQILENKIGLPENNQVVDDLTGQPTGHSKGSKITYPETHVLAGLGLEQTLIEVLKYRGGDEGGFIAMNASIERTGGVSLKAIEPLSTGVKSLQAVRAYLTAMQLKTTL